MSGYDFGIVTVCLFGAASLLLLKREKEKKKRGRKRERKRKTRAISCIFRRISIIFVGVSD